MSRLETHLKALQDTAVEFTFELVYFNSSTAKILMGLFDPLDETARNGNPVDLVWVFETDDDDMQELGEEFGEDLRHAKFELRELAAE